MSRVHQHYRQTTWARAQPLRGLGGPDPPKFGWTTPTFYVAADCSARNWIYHPYFVLYNNLDQGIGPQLWKHGCVAEHEFTFAKKTCCILFHRTNWRLQLLFRWRPVLSLKKSGQSKAFSMHFMCHRHLPEVSVPSSKVTAALLMSFDRTSWPTSGICVMPMDAVIHVAIDQCPPSEDALLVGANHL